jgi:hypothetical protein
MNDEKSRERGGNQELAQSPPPPGIPPQNEAVLRNAEQNPTDNHVHVAANPPRGTRPIEWLQLGVNVALAMIGVLAIYIYGRQLDAMKGQLVSMKDAAASSSMQIRTQERGWIGMEIREVKFIAGQPAKASVQISNIGRSPVLNVVTEMIVEKLLVTQSPTLDFSKLDPRNVYSLGAIFQNSVPESDEVVWYDGGTPTEPSPIGRLTTTDAEDIATGKTYFVFYGRTSYTDTFVNIHETRFCRIYPSANLLPLTTKEVCLNYNGTDAVH